VQRNGIKKHQIALCFTKVSAQCITPAEMIKCRTQINHNRMLQFCQIQIIFPLTFSSGVSPIRAFISVFNDHGLKGIFRGLSSTIARDVPFTFLFFGGYEACTKVLSSSNSPIVCNLSKNLDTDNSLNPVGIYFAGGFAGAFSWAVVFPIDSIKSRIQTILSGDSISFVSMASSMYRQVGLRSFYMGWSSAVMRAFPANAGLFLGYEMSMELFKKL
jgi:hypothetical protein